jgi:hypothetical protein
MLTPVFATAQEAAGATNGGWDDVGHFERENVYDGSSSHPQWHTYGASAMTLRLAPKRLSTEMFVPTAHRPFRRALSRPARGGGGVHPAAVGALQSLPGGVA